MPFRWLFARSLGVGQQQRVSLVMGSLGARQSRQEPAIPGCNVVFMNLLGSLHMGPVAQMTHSEVLQGFSFFLRRVGKKRLNSTLNFYKKFLRKGG